MEFATVSDVKRIELPRHVQENGELVVIEEGQSVPFPVLRTFTVRAAEGAVRGRHAHKRCAQFLICVHGSIEVLCDDGAEKAGFVLESGHHGLLVPPSIWATETYRTPDAVLAVLCDRRYEVEDYIRNYEAYLAWRKAGTAVLADG